MEWDRLDNQAEVSLEHHTVLIVLDGQFLLKVLCTDVAAVLVESRSWQDRNLKFGPNCDLEVDNFFCPNYPPSGHNLQAKF